MARAAAALLGAGVAPEEPARLWRVPGRIEVLGKHTDYAGGRSLLAATEPALWVVATPRRDGRLRVLAVDRSDAVTVTLSSGVRPRAGHWSLYPATVAHRVAANFPGPLRGVDIAMSSELPEAAGMSSSSAVVVGVFLALSAREDLASRSEYRRAIPDSLSLAAYLGTVENGQSFGDLAGDRGVGTFGGSEDHTAILHGRAGRLAQFSFGPIRRERSIALPEGATFVVGVSGVVAEKTGAARDRYNRVSRLASALTAEWHDVTGERAPHLSAIASGASGAARLARAIASSPPRGEFTGEELLARLEQFVAESDEIVPAAGDALERGSLAEFGRLVDRSQALAERCLANQVEETVWLAASAREEGAHAASAFGAGFGGSVWALVDAAGAGDFIQRWRSRYLERFPGREPGSRFLVTGAGDGASEVTGSAP